MRYRLTSNVMGSLYIKSLNMILSYSQSILISDYQVTREIHVLRSRNLIRLVPIGG
jgi:hypothetical protein